MSIKNVLLVFLKYKMLIKRFFKNLLITLPLKTVKSVLYWKKNTKPFFCKQNKYFVSAYVLTTAIGYYWVHVEIIGSITHRIIYFQDDAQTTEVLFFILQLCGRTPH